MQMLSLSFIMGRRHYLFEVRIHHFPSNLLSSGLALMFSTPTGWADGDVCKCNLLGLPISAVAAISTTIPSLRVQVFLQGINGLLWQAFFSPQGTRPFHWTHGSLNIPAVLLGSSIAATYLESVAFL